MSGTISRAPAVPYRVFQIIKWFLAPFPPPDTISPAKVAIARRLALRLYWMLRTRHNYAQLVHMSGSPSSAGLAACGIERRIGHRASPHEAGRLHGESWYPLSGIA